MADHAAYRDNNRVEDVAGERHPAFVHQHEQITEVGKRGIAYKDTRRILIDLIQRLERVVLCARGDGRVED